MSRLSTLGRLLRLPPPWVLLLAFAAAAGVAAWRSVSQPGAQEPAYFLQGLLWPGAAIFAAVYVFAWLGWALEID